MNEVQAQELAGEAWAAGCKLAEELSDAKFLYDIMLENLIARQQFTDRDLAEMKRERDDALAEIDRLRQAGEKLVKAYVKWAAGCKLAEDIESGSIDMMRLPEGMTCGDCVRFSQCRNLGICSAQENETRCDWNPSQFMKRDDAPKGANGE